MLEVSHPRQEWAWREPLMRANKGETIVITVDGIPMAELQPVSTKRRWVPKAELEIR